MSSGKDYLLPKRYYKIYHPGGHSDFLSGSLLLHLCRLNRPTPHSVSEFQSLRVWPQLSRAISLGYRGNTIQRCEDRDVNSLKETALCYNAGSPREILPSVRLRFWPAIILKGLLLVRLV